MNPSPRFGSFRRLRPLLAGAVAFPALAACTGPERVVRYECGHGMRLAVTYEEAAHRVVVADPIGQVRVLPEVSHDATGTVYRDAVVTFIDTGPTAIYAANDSDHSTTTCVAANTASGS
jgi:hypothetical protein